MMWYLCKASLFITPISSQTCTVLHYDKPCKQIPPEAVSPTCQCLFENQCSAILKNYQLTTSAQSPLSGLQHNLKTYHLQESIYFNDSLSTRSMMFLLNEIHICFVSNRWFIYLFKKLYNQFPTLLINMSTFLKTQPI